MPRKLCPGNSKCINGGKIAGKALPFRARADESDIKSDIMANQNTASAEFKKLRKYLLDRILSDDHFIRNMRKPRDAVRDWNLRIHKLRELIDDRALKV